MNAAIPSPPYWVHDLVSCLQATFASLLMSHGHDPVLALGANWDFYHVPGDVRKEEFYYPPRSASFAQSLFPYHPITSRWHLPGNNEAGWAEVREHVRKGQLAIVAVDNYYLPFRPAYKDVHAAHLVIVHGFDEESGEVSVLDSMPPAFAGRIRIEELQAARNSGNPNDGSDDFFASMPIQNRWLEVSITGPFPELTRDWVKSVIAANVERFRSRNDGPGYSGMPGLARYLSELHLRATGPAGMVALEELYVLGWPLQAGTALHADFLMQAGRQLGWHDLVETGRLVDRLAHHWTALRMTGAHGRTNPAAVAERLARRGAQLLSDQEAVLQRMEWLLTDA